MAKKNKTIAKWLPDVPKKRQRCSRVVIYDFDGTIFNSPDREQGETTYFEATGRTFPFPGWWGRLESLMPPVVPDKPGKEWLIEATIAAYREDIKDQDAEIILMTGRPFKNRKRVLEICGHFDLTFHEHYFRGQPGQRGRDTLEIKSNFIQDLMNPKLKILEIWEDRPEHVSAFLDAAKRWKSNYSNHLEKVIIHNVVSGENHLV